MEVVALSEKAQEKAKPFVKGRDGLRIKVIGGGCSGLRYSLEKSDIDDMDNIHEYPNGLVVMVDPKSAVLLQGSKMEFSEGLSGSGFEINNPNATNGCGCGKSFGV